MTQNLQIQCINKTDRYNAHERIAYVGGSMPSRWKRSQQQAITATEAGTERYYVSVGGSTVWVIVARTAAGHKYLKTQNDGEQPNNLLSLPECP